MKEQEEIEFKAVKNLYTTLLENFKSNKSKQLRDLAIEKNILDRVLDKIAQIGKEKKRRWVESKEEQP